MEFRRVLIRSRLRILLFGLVVLNILCFVASQTFGTGLAFQCAIRNNSIKYYQQLDSDNMDTLARSSQMLTAELGLLDALQRVDQYWNQGDERLKGDSHLYAEFITLQQKYPELTAVLNGDSSQYSQVMMQLGEKRAALETVLSQATYILSFQDKLTDIDRQAQQMEQASIFAQADSFSSKNILKTQRDYGALNGLPVEPGHGISESLSAVVDYVLGPVSVLIASILIVNTLLEGRNSSFFQLEFSTAYGRRKLSWRRCRVLFAGIAIFAYLLYGMLYVVSLFFFGGWQDLHLPIQSVPCFQDLLLSISTFDFLFLYPLFIISICFCFGLIYWGICLLVQYQNIALLLLGALMGIEFVFYVNLPPQSSFNVIKYANITYFLSPAPFFTEYRNLSVLGLLIEKRTFFSLFILLVIGVSGVWILWVSDRKPRSSRLLDLIVGRIDHYADRLGQIRAGILQKTDLLGIELYKLLFVQKAIFLVPLLIVGFIWNGSHSQVYDDVHTKLWNDFCVKYQGVPGEMVEQYRQSLQTKLEEVAVRYENAKQAYLAGNMDVSIWFDEQYHFQAYSDQGKLLLLIDDRLAYLKDLYNETGVQGWILNTSAYDALWGETAWRQERVMGILMTAIMVAFIPGLITYEVYSGTKRLLRTYLKGRDNLFRTKVLALLLFIIFYFILIYGSHFIRTILTHQIYALSAPIQSLPYFRYFPYKIQISMFAALLYFIKLLLTFAGGCIILYFAQSVSPSRVPVVIMAVFLLPAGLYEIGVTWLFPVSYNVILAGIEIWYRNGTGYYAIEVSILLSLAIVALYLAKKRWCTQLRSIYEARS